MVNGYPLIKPVVYLFLLNPCTVRLEHFEDWLLKCMLGYFVDSIIYDMDDRTSNDRMRSFCMRSHSPRFIVSSKALLWKTHRT